MNPRKPKLLFSVVALKKTINSSLASFVDAVAVDVEDPRIRCDVTHSKTPNEERLARNLQNTKDILVRPTCSTQVPNKIDELFRYQDIASS